MFDVPSFDMIFAVMHVYEPGFNMDKYGMCVYVH